MSDVIQTLWIGDKLTSMESVCLRSFVENGHQVHLYTYGHVENVPSGVDIKDGNEILSKDMIFFYKEHKSYSGFSNYFRYKLLYEKGGYWIDTDILCVKKFDFDSPYVFCSEEVLPLGQSNTHIGSCVIKAPKGSLAMKDAFDICMKKDPEKLKWGEIGPRLVRSTVEKYNMQFFVKPPEVFCPIPGCHWHLFVNPKISFKPGVETYAVHFWNEMWRRNEVDKNSKFHDSCFYEEMKKKYV